MYKVFLVDDEPLVIKSLKASVNWNRYGFEIAGHALGGEEAYARILDTLPEVVFTDVRMPGMSGLELIKAVKESAPQTIFIVVSGYAEFAYAQKAMNYGALGYCLKPFDAIELAGYLKKVKELLDASRPLNESEIMDLIEDNSGSARTALGKILAGHGVEMDSANPMHILVSIGKRKLFIPDGKMRLALKIGLDKYAYFVVDFEAEELRRCLEDADAADIKGAGISREVRNTEGIREAIHDAEIRAFDYFISSERVSTPPVGPDSGLKDNALKRLEEAIAGNDPEAVLSLLDKAEELFARKRLNIKHAIIIYNQVMSFSYKVRDEQYEDYIYSYDKLAEMFGNIREVLLFLKSSLFEPNTIKSELAAGKSRNCTFNSILKYVNENYCNDISTQSISKIFSVNANYISQLFKKESGIAFTEYLSNLRIDHACVSLKTTDLPIREIAEQVGYSDYFYFSRVFKKITGKSPSLFRGRREDRDD
jgi:two-component system response regulator YesN